MKIVIDIPKEMHKALEQGSFGAKYNMYDLVGCVMNGILLPKGHGKLIDSNVLWDAFQDLGQDFYEAFDFAEANAVIEADEDGDTDG